MAGFVWRRWILAAGAAVLMTGFVFLSHPEGRGKVSALASLAQSGDWTQLTVDVAISHSRSDLRTPLDASSRYQLRRTLTGAANWRTVVTFAQAPTRQARGPWGLKPIDNPFEVARIEMDRDGDVPRIYDRRGVRIASPSAKQRSEMAGRFPKDLSELARLYSADQGNPSPGNGPAGGREWARGLVVTEDASAQRRAALQQKHGRSTQRVRGLDQFVSRSADRFEEILVHPQLGVPMEINLLTNGALTRRTLFKYDESSNGVALLRSVRYESAVDGSGARRVSELQYNNLQLERR
jgi:hypothetical protein